MSIPAAFCRRTVSATASVMQASKAACVIGLLPLAGEDEIHHLLAARQAADMGRENGHERSRFLQ
jgi:hypothetical protein